MAQILKRIKEEVIGVIAIMASLYFSLIFLTYSLKDDVPFFRITKPPEPVRNSGGVIGASISGWLIIFLGVAAYLIPVFILVFGIKRLLGKEGHKIYILGNILLVFSVSFLSSLMADTFNIQLNLFPDGIGGLIGKMLSYTAEMYLSYPGAYILSLSLLLVSLILVSPLSVTNIALIRKPKEKDFQEKENVPEDEEIIIKDIEPAPVVKANEPEVIQSHDTIIEKPVKDGTYKLPPIELLNISEFVSSKPTKEEIMNDSSLIEKKLSDFGVEGRVATVHPGPIVTMYEFEPAPGVKITRIVSLSDDLALALKAQSVRISPIPGRAVIGIEVPNKKREIVCLREIIASENFKKSKSRLTLGLGKDISGAPVVADLSKMPHLLVAGATGSGKSVSINSMIVSILYKATPDEVKMLMVDPKLLELSAYEEIPHLLSPVITNPKEAAEGLKKMVIEMERRYRVIAEKGVRNIESFNLQCEGEERLPYIVIIIDELADLMFTAPNDVEDSIARLAQMGRASGIHLILATQRPSVDVITGIIKANFPARISFQVTSKVDSRTILDSGGAEQLLGKGDLLLMLPGTKIIRVHGALVTEEEIKAITEFIKVQGHPDYTLFNSIQMPVEKEEELSSERDEMYYKAVEIGEATGEISISSIQRRLKIGYNRAARIMELLEEDGLVGPPKGAGKPRDFLRRR